MKDELLDDFHREFDLVGLFVRVEFHKGLDIAIHHSGTRLDEVLLFGLFFRILAPFHRLL